jgi:hypothetical protein
MNPKHGKNKEPQLFSNNTMNETMVHHFTTSFTPTTPVHQSYASPHKIITFKDFAPCFCPNKETKNATLWELCTQNTPPWKSYSIGAS